MIRHAAKLTRAHQTILVVLVNGVQSGRHVVRKIQSANGTNYNVLSVVPEFTSETLEQKLEKMPNEGEGKLVQFLLHSGQSYRSQQ